MWQPRTRQYDDPFFSPLSVSSYSASFKWPRATRSSRFFGLRITPIKFALFLLIFGVFLVIRSALLNSDVLVKSTAATEYISLQNTTFVPAVALAPFQPPTQTEPGQYRHADTVDTFASYKFRNSCNVSSLDLHAAFSPLCGDRQEALDAMSGGGRIGVDGRFMSRGCDMRWFTSEEICEILGRFEKLVLIGDSMLRHVIGSINVLVRKDLGYGAVTDWNFSMQEKRECFCNEQFDVKSCSVQGIYKTADVLAHDPDSLSCTNPINVIMEEVVRYPIPAEEVSRLKASLKSSNPMSPSSISSSISKLSARSTAKDKPIAIIFGHGLWSNLDLQKTVDWFDAVLNTIITTLGHDNWYGLFVTPSAAGKDKPDDWIVSQGNKALVLFEEAVGLEVGKRHVQMFGAGSGNKNGALEHLGTWNMSIQARTYDGVHLDMKGNLVKAMMVMNWLAMI